MVQEDDAGQDEGIGFRAREPRRQAREAALRMLYQWEVGRIPIAEAAEACWALEPEQPEPGVREFAVALARGTAEAVETIDGLLAAHAEHWRVSRMAVIDRLILRLAVHEMLEHRSTPRAVVINEALELARAYSSDQAVSFVNGVLDAIGRRLEDDRAGGRPEASDEEGPDASGA